MQFLILILISVDSIYVQADNPDVMEKLVKFSTINMCADQYTKVYALLYENDLNEKTLDLSKQLASLFIMIFLGLLGFLLGFYFARFAHVEK